VINIGPDDEFITINELTAAIGEILKLRGPADLRKGRPGSAAELFRREGRRLLGYHAHVTPDGLISMVEYIRHRGTGRSSTTSTWRSSTRTPET
jgi:UDP-glucose 4-epimerase